MTGPELIPGATYAVGAACGVPHGFRPIRLRLIHEMPHGGWEGMTRLLGYELDTHGDAVEQRDIYVIAAGLQLLDMPATANPPARPTNAGPARIPRPRTSPETTTGRTR
jgi:hypothetical protein